MGKTLLLVHIRGRSKIALTIGAALLFTGCTVHPPGEQAEREAARRAGRSFSVRPAARVVPPLPENPTPEQLVDFALQSNADLEQKYWEWRSAIEQIPQDGTQPTNLVLSANLAISRGRTGFDQATLSAGNDPMTDIVLPPKLSAAARRALENARAAGLRFRKTQFELRAKVLDAWYDYALTAELIRLEQSNAQLLRTTAMIVEARNSAGSAGQQDVLKARNEVDFSNNDAEAMQAQLPAQRAALNALLNRDAGAPLPTPHGLPTGAPLTYTDAQVLLLVCERNPELAAQAREIASRREGVTLAKLQYLPDVSLSAGTDLKGLAQSLLGMVTVPALRHEAIDAAVAQANANVRVAQAMRRQTDNNLAAQLLMDLATLRDSDRQLNLFGTTVLPRTEQAVTLARSAYESGRATLLDLLDSQRSLISIRRLVANLRSAREKRLADADAITARELR
jgi:outer membrane protein TolC